MRPVAVSEPSRRVFVALAVLPLLASASFAQAPRTVTLRGYISAVRTDGFDLDGKSIEILPDTQFYSFYGSKNSECELRQAIAADKPAIVLGTPEQNLPSVAAGKVVVWDEAGSEVSGLAVIDKVLAGGTNPVFRAGGHALRVSQWTDLRFSDDLAGLSQVNTDIVIAYRGNLLGADKVFLTRAEFFRPKEKAFRPADEAGMAQATTFSLGSMVDLEGRFSDDAGDQWKHRPQDEGGSCGWHFVSPDPAVEERVRRIGERVVPRYQRELPDDDPGKIPFRFYAVDENDLQGDLGCGNSGLVLIPTAAVARLRNDDQLAAVLADRVAASLVQVPMGQRIETGLTRAAVASSGVFGAGVGMVVTGRLAMNAGVNKIREQRGRMALGYLADAGFNPRQSPEAWRLLAPADMPKDPSKLKYPLLAKFELHLLDMEQKDAATSENP